MPRNSSPIGKVRHAWAVSLAAMATVVMMQGAAIAQAADRGTIRVFSPVQMRVFVDGNAIASGTTPVELRDVLPGPHAVVARAEGYKDCSFTLQVQQGRVTRVELRPVPSAMRVAVRVDAQDFHHRMVGQITYRIIDYTISFDRAALRAHLQNKLMQTAGIQVVMEGAPADFTLCADFHGNMDNVTGTFTMADREGILLGSDTRSVRMPMGYDDNMTPFAMKRAREIVDKTMPALVDKMNARANSPVPAPVIVTE